MKRIHWIGLTIIVAVFTVVGAYLHFNKSPVDLPSESREARKARLLQELQSKEDATVVAYSLGNEFGPDAKEAIPLLCYRYGRGIRQNTYSSALNQIVPGLNVPFDCYHPNKHNESPQKEAYLAVKQLGPEALDAYIDGLITALQQVHPGERNQAANAVSVMGDDGRKAIPFLVAIVNKPENPFGSDAHSAAKALLALGNDDAAPKGFVLAAKWAYPMEDSKEAIAMLGKMKRKARSAVPELLEYYRELKQDKDTDFSGDFRRRLAETIKAIGFPATSIPELIKMLKGNDSDENILAAELLEGIGPEASDAVPALIEVFNKGIVLKEAVRALAAIRDAKASPHLRRALTNKTFRSDVTIEIALAVWKIDGDKETAMAALMDLLRESSSPREAAQGLIEIGPVQSMVPTLTFIVGDNRTTRDIFRHLTHVDRRAAAALVLGKIGADAKNSVPALRAALKYSEVSIRVAAALALWRVTKQTEDSIPPLIEILQGIDYASVWVDKNEAAAADSARALAEMGPQAKAALPTLLMAFKKTGSLKADLHRAAADALKKIDAETAKKEKVDIVD